MSPVDFAEMKNSKRQNETKSQEESANVSKKYV